MRLSDNLLVQRTDDLIVVMDESTGDEQTAPATMETLLHTIDDVAIARAQAGPAGYTFQGIAIPDHLLDGFLHGLGYLITGRP